jgi:hypothetical protein
MYSCKLQGQASGFFIGGIEIEGVVACKSGIFFRLFVSGEKVCISLEIFMINSSEST